MKYSNRRTSLPRRCVFAISLNPDHGGYLADDENRRYWPVLCDGEIDTAGLRQARDQLWAEALAMWRAGLSWWPATPAEKALCGEHQQGREIVDAWTDRVRESVRCIPSVTIAAVLDTVGVELARRTQADTRRAAKVRRGLGWVEAPSRKGGARVWHRGLDAVPIEANAKVVPLFSVDDKDGPANIDLQTLLDSV
jgi:predicted P-loop ATPase